MNERTMQNCILENLIQETYNSLISIIPYQNTVTFNDYIYFDYSAYPFAYPLSDNETNENLTKKIQNYLQLIEKIQLSYCKKHGDGNFIPENDIPKKLYEDPNFGDKESIFYSKYSTFIHIEINGLNDFVFTMSPKQIMSSAETIYNAINAIAQKYEDITPIKESDDVYIAIVGMFSGEEVTPEKQINDAVCFADEVLSEMDNVNEQLDSEIPLGISIATGGEAVGYIGDPNNLRIDVSSDVLNLVIKMQDIGELNVIQINQAASSLLINPKFERSFSHKVQYGDKEEAIYSLHITNPFDIHQTTPSD